MKPENKQEKIKPEHRRGEIPDSIYLLIEKVVDDMFIEFDKMEDFEFRRLPKNQRLINRVFNELMREGFHDRMRNK